MLTLKFAITLSIIFSYFLIFFWDSYGYIIPKRFVITFRNYRNKLSETILYSRFIKHFVPSFVCHITSSHFIPQIYFILYGPSTFKILTTAYIRNILNFSIKSLFQSPILSSFAFEDNPEKHCLTTLQ